MKADRHGIFYKENKMGGTSTKFKKHLQRGDEYAAMRVNIKHFMKQKLGSITFLIILLCRCIQTLQNLRL